MNHWLTLAKVMALGITRDKVLRVIFLSGLLFLLLAPFFSMFSMRQVQQLLVTVSLSWISLTLLVLALILGSSSIWRDIERRWLFAVFGLPVERASYVLARITAIFSCLLVAGCFLGAIGAVLINIAGSEYSTALHFSWVNYSFAVLFAIAKYMLLAAIATFFSTVGTSFFLPIFGTFSVFLAGSASQGVIDYLSIAGPDRVAASTLFFAKLLYWLLPNFAVFDLTTQAVYGLNIDSVQLFFGGGYFLVYTSIIICCAIFSMNRRELK